LIGKFDSRKLLGAGVIFSAGAMFLLSRLSLDVGMWNFWWPLMLQGAALGLIFVPLTTVTNDPIPREQMGNATSIFNLMRNIGASIGISVVQTLQFRRLQSHINVLGKYVNPGNAEAMRMIDGLRQSFMAQGYDAAAATRRAYATTFGMIQQQAAMLSYNDVFFILAIMFLVMFPFVLLMRKAKRGGPVMVH
jgi:MFS transporter, DHA2 family, multidrug resistance protein